MNWVKQPKKIYCVFENSSPCKTKFLCCSFCTKSCVDRCKDNCATCKYLSDEIAQNDITFTTREKRKQKNQQKESDVIKIQPSAVRYKKRIKRSLI